MISAGRGRPSRAVVEAAFSLGLGLLLAVIVRRPQDLASSVPADQRDPVLLSWVLSWPAHALTSEDRLFDGNIFAPLDNTVAFTDLLLGYLPFGLVGEGPAAALVRYNVVLLFAFGLAFAGTWVLVRQLGLGRAAALVAATAFAFNPWRVSQLNHIQVLSSGGIPLALALLARGHGVRLRSGGAPVRPGWAFAGWLVATWHISIGFGLGLQLAYLLAFCTAVAAVLALVRRSRGGAWPSTRLLVADGAGMLAMLGISGALALPYLQAVEDHPQSRRDLSEVTFYSPSPKALVTAPGDSWMWGRAGTSLREGVGGINEKALFPGATVVLLAAAGLLPGPWRGRRRLTLLAAVVVSVVLALGTSGPFGGRVGYLLLYEHAPGWQGIRTPSRLVTVAWLALAVLAAHGVAVLQSAAARLRGGPDPAASLALALGLTGLVLLEGLDTAPQSAVLPPPSVALASLPEPVMVLPSSDGFDQNVMLWSTAGWPRVVNGVSGFVPAELTQLRAAAGALPDPAALQRLRESGVATLLLLPDALPGTEYAALSADQLRGLPGVQVESYGDAVVVRLTAGGAG